MYPTLDLDSIFTYHAPFGDQVERYNKIREGAKAFAQIIVDNSPKTAEQTLAIRNVQLAMMMANAGITCNEVQNY